MGLSVGVCNHGPEIERNISAILTRLHHSHGIDLLMVPRKPETPTGRRALEWALERGITTALGIKRGTDCIIARGNPKARRPDTPYWVSRVGRDRWEYNDALLEMNRSPE